MFENELVNARNGMLAQTSLQSFGGASASGSELTESARKANNMSKVPTFNKYKRQ